MRFISIFLMVTVSLSSMVHGARAELDTVQLRLTHETNKCENLHQAAKAKVDRYEQIKKPAFMASAFEKNNYKNKDLHKRAYIESVTQFGMMKNEKIKFNQIKDSAKLEEELEIFARNCKGFKELLDGFLAYTTAKAENNDPHRTTYSTWVNKVVCGKNYCPKKP